VPPGRGRLPAARWRHHRRRCGQRVARAQDEPRPRAGSRGCPGQLEGISQDLVLLRALRRPLVRPALGQDRPVRVGAVNFDALPRRHGDRGRVQLHAKLRAEKVKHHPFRPALLSGISGRHGSAHGGAGSAGAPCPGVTVLATSGAPPGSRSWSPTRSLTILPSGPGRRRTIPVLSGPRQIWFTVCRGAMPVRAAIWSSSRGCERGCPPGPPQSGQPARRAARQRVPDHAAEPRAGLAPSWSRPGSHGPAATARSPGPGRRAAATRRVGTAGRARAGRRRARPAPPRP
jgi:hypothetical protein